MTLLTLPHNITNSNKQMYLINDIITLFTGLTPAAARRHHIEQLQQESVEVLANSSVNPPTKWIENQYRIWRNSELGGVSSNEDFFRFVYKCTNDLFSYVPVTNNV
jgi:hypothetical protein